MAAGWDDTPAATGDAGAWQADEAVGSAVDVDDFDGISPENVSKHANGPSDGGCRVCHEDGHFARDCPNKQEGGGRGGGCFNCGEDGHNKSDCPHPPEERGFTGECRFCGQTGHRARECPDKPAETCRICKVEGHIASDCDANRMIVAFQTMNIPDMTQEDAWKMLEQADNEKDVGDIKEAIFAYAKSCPTVTYQELEDVFRKGEMNTHLIAKQQEVSDTHTIVNLQGQQDQEFVVSVQFSAEPKRQRFKEGWPENPEENMARLAKAGVPMDRMVPKCRNCEQLGHTAKACTEEKVEREQLAISCANCNEEGHRARDCPQPRKSGKKGCKNCGQDGHIAKECPEPPNPENVECKNCGTMGHFSRDCPDREPEICRNCQEEGHRAKDCTKERVIICRNCDQPGHTGRECPEPRNMAKVQCRNCDEMGHTGRDCPKPTDWSRVECSNCKQKGHTFKRCNNPPADADGNEIGGGDGAAAGGWGAGDTAPAQSSGGW